MSKATDIKGAPKSKLKYEPQMYHTTNTPDQRHPESLKWKGYFESLKEIK